MVAVAGRVRDFWKLLDRVSKQYDVEMALFGNVSLMHEILYHHYCDIYDLKYLYIFYIFVICWVQYSFFENYKKTFNFKQLLKF
jgi:hypothetical protein